MSLYDSMCVEKDPLFNTTPAPIKKKKESKSKELFELRRDNEKYSKLMLTYKTRIFELIQDKKHITKKYIQKVLTELLEMD